jgi:hypothetical protein
VRWSATTSALVAVVALFGATAVASSLVAVRQPAPPSSSADARLASLTSDRPADTVPTTAVERRAPRATTTTIAAAPVVVDTAPPAPSPFVGVDAGPDVVAFGTTTDPAAACEAIARWRVARAHPETNVVVSEDGQRLEERDPTSGEVLGVLATWDAAAGAPAGDGVAPDDQPPACAPPVEQPTAPAETTTVPAAEG